MLRRLATPLPLALSGIVACGPAPPDFGDQRPSVALEPAAPLDSAPSVLRVEVEGFRLPPAALALFQGELSNYYLGELKDGKVPASLRERQVPAEAWIDRSAKRTVLAPSIPLVGGDVYTVAVIGARPLATLRVDASSGPAYAARVWPPHEAPRGGGRWVFCSTSIVDQQGTHVSFDPGGVLASANPGVDSEDTMRESCVRFEPESNPGAGVGVPPTRFSGLALDPASVDFAIDLPPAVGSCHPTELALGGACATVLDDRAIVRSGSVPLLVALRIGSRTELDALLPGAPTVIRELPVQSRIGVSGTATDLAGHEAPFGVDFVTSAPLPHIILNEVLANPLGPEPSQEWIEIVNDGTTTVSLGDLLFEDSEGAQPLPPATLEPGKFGLIVSSSYAADDGRDVPPMPGTLVLRLPRLGLSNSGEALTLRAANGTTLSRFPSLVSPRAGVSIARRTPWSLDGTPSSFGLHVGRGASPGWGNDIGAP